MNHCSVLEIHKFDSAKQPFLYFSVPLTLCLDSILPFVWQAQIKQKKQQKNNENLEKC